MTATRSVEDGAAVQAVLRPAPQLEERIRAFLDGQLGRVLSSRGPRGVDWYYDWVVLGSRSLEALEIISHHRDPRSDRPVLDVGSGLGSFVLLANSVGLPARGVEPGAGEVELARARQAAIPELAGRDLFGRGTGEQLPYGDAEFSAVLLHDVLEHVGDWRAVLREARRVLAPGGVVYAKSPNYAMRFQEPHYHVPWLPLLPKVLARPYLRALGRDVGYLDHLGWCRRGQVLATMKDLGFELRFPRHEKLADPRMVNRRWARALATPFRGDGPLGSIGRRVAENPLQSVIDVVGRVPPS